MGDGSFGMCAGELETLARLQLPLTAIVINYLAFRAELSPTQWLGIALLTGLKLTVVLAIFLIVLIGSAITFRLVWGNKVGELSGYANEWRDRAQVVAPQDGGS